MEYNEIDVNAVCCGILCNFQQFCGEERAKESAALVRKIYEDNKKLHERAESAESRAETLEKMVKEYQEVIVPGCREQAEKAERERDAAVFDLLRAEEAAEETNALLDDEVHPACDYSLYLSIHDSVSDIVNWQKDDVWRGKKVERE